MSHQPENEALTPQELCQALVSELDASKQVLSELSDEDLTAVTGAFNRAVSEIQGPNNQHPWLAEGVKAAFYRYARTIQQNHS